MLGIYEALELRDGGSDYLGKGVSKVSFGLKKQSRFLYVSELLVYMYVVTVI